MYNSFTRKYDYSFLEEMSHCSEFDLDDAIDRSVHLLSFLGKNQQDSYKYITYDTGIGGSHEKIYTWNYFSGKYPLCLHKKDEEKQKQVIGRFFPRDVSWEKFHMSNDNSRVRSK